MAHKPKALRTGLLKGLIVVVLLVYLLPMAWMILNTFKSQLEMFRNPPNIWPANFTLKSYTTVWSSTAANLLTSFKNSMIISLYTMAVSLILGIPCAYGLARLRLKGMTALMYVFILGQMIAPSVKMLPLFIMLNDMNLINTYESVVISLSTFSMPFSVLVMRPYFLSVPQEIDEAARIDGCSRLRAFRSVILPVCYPGAIVAGIFAFLGGWNDLIFAFTMLTSSDKRPMITSIYKFIEEHETRQDLVLTFALYCAIPIVVLFILCQRYIVDGLTFGSVKG